MRRLLALAVAGVLVGTTGCAKQSAESAIAQAEKTVASMQDEAQKLAPNDLKALTDTIASLKARVAAGDYSAALMGARSAGSMARDLQSGLVVRRTQLTNSYNAMSAELPKQVETLTAKINQLAGMKKLPAGLDPAKFAALKTDAAGWAATWAAATDAYKAGNVADAVTKATDLKNRLAAATALIGA